VDKIQFTIIIGYEQNQKPTGPYVLEDNYFEPSFSILFLYQFTVHAKKIPDRVYFNKSTKLFKLVSNKQERFFSTKFQNYNSYKYGAAKRDQLLRHEYLLEHVQLENEDYIVDCGANIGDFWHALNQESDVSLNYFAFEPSREEFNCLELNIKEKVNLFNIGLWDKKDKLKFYISSKNADSSIIEPESYTKTISLEVDRLDNVIRANKIKLLKLEAEGAEMQVLNGAKELLMKIEYITADLGLENKGESTLPEVTNYLLSNGFQIIDFGFPRVVVLFKNQLFN
jgi:FkbM family methyltransferase